MKKIMKNENVHKVHVISGKYWLYIVQLEYIKEEEFITKIENNKLLLGDEKCEFSEKSEIKWVNYSDVHKLELHRFFLTILKSSKDVLNNLNKSLDS
jgi:hypothetical protein